MKRLLLSTLFLACLICMSICLASAQRIYIGDVGQGQGGIIMDCSAETGMPQRVVTTVKKYVGKTNGFPFLPIEQAVYTYLYGSNKTAEALNSRIYYRLQIHEGIEEFEYDANVPWVGAMGVCKERLEPFGEWRLPTMKEAQIMSIFQTAIDQANNILSPDEGVPFALETDYWTATEYNGYPEIDNPQGTSAHFINYKTGMTNYTDKINREDKAIRCVREL